MNDERSVYYKVYVIWADLISKLPQVLIKSAHLATLVTFCTRGLPRTDREKPTMQKKCYDYGNRKGKKTKKLEKRKRIRKKKMEGKREKPREIFSIVVTRLFIRFFFYFVVTQKKKSVKFLPLIFRQFFSPAPLFFTQPGAFFLSVDLSVNVDASRM